MIKRGRPSGRSAVSTLKLFSQKKSEQKFNISLKIFKNNN